MKPNFRTETEFTNYMNNKINKFFQSNKSKNKVINFTTKNIITKFADNINKDKLQNKWIFIKEGNDLNLNKFINAHKLANDELISMDKKSKVTAKFSNSAMNFHQKNKSDTFITINNNCKNNVTSIFKKVNKETSTNEEDEMLKFRLKRVPLLPIKYEPLSIEKSKFNLDDYYYSLNETKNSLSTNRQGNPSKVQLFNELIIKSRQITTRIAEINENKIETIDKEINKDKQSPSPDKKSIEYFHTEKLRPNTSTKFKVALLTKNHFKNLQQKKDNIDQMVACGSIKAIKSVKRKNNSSWDSAITSSPMKDKINLKLSVNGSVQNTHQSMPGIEKIPQLDSNIFDLYKSMKKKGNQNNSVIENLKNAKIKILNLKKEVTKSSFKMKNMVDDLKRKVIKNELKLKEFKKKTIMEKIKANKSR